MLQTCVFILVAGHRVPENPVLQLTPPPIMRNFLRYFLHTSVIGT